jgi:putative Mg2+ transporter-C (MgtC) family protein
MSDLDRERRIGAAGMRTHMLVGIGSALFMLVSLFGFSDVLGTPGVMLDPS